MHLLWQKMGWATFWANFSQTHLVTLNYRSELQLVDVTRMKRMIAYLTQQLIEQIVSDNALEGPA
jgi:hypothetical protein